MFAAVLDTNVLWPSLRRDFLLSLAFEGLYRPLWNDVILDELEYEEAKKLRRRGFDDGTAHRQASGLVAALSDHFADALVKHFPESLVPGHVQVTDSATFARDTVTVSPERAVPAVRELARRRAQGSVETVLGTLEKRYGMHNAVEILRQVL